ncbi:CvpA family protein [Zhongshania aliphaticivorans]|uniref:CvpA family protein n=1 Tax=Zhongshania aliphaticivorans TaxID=1470434 RepID=UPI0012E6DAF5|nr:CvpA family protein [Zhongshania aliphaticivorans]CAA0079622.1 Colicin V production protein [Zhongshania aliphaticivorans]
MLSTFNWADWAILAVISASALISLIRGFVKEALSLLSWAVAFFIAVAFHPQAVALLEPLVDKVYLREILAYVLVFITTLVLGSLVTHIIAVMVKRTGLSGTDRLLGMIFGTARGLIVVLAVLVLLPSMLTGVENDQWWKESQLIPEFLLMKDWSEQSFNDVVSWGSSLLSSQSS